MSRPRNRTAVAAFVVAVALTGCTATPAPTTTPPPSATPSAPPGAGPAPSTAAPSVPPVATPAPATTPNAPATTGAAPTPTPGPEAWSTADASLPATGPANTGSYLTNIRVAGHPEGNFDRIALDFDGHGPELRAHYVPEVFHDASGHKVELDGGAYVQLAFGAAAHNEAGDPTLLAAPYRADSTGLPGLRSYAMNGDFEGVLSIALGQATQAGFKVGQVNSGGTTTIYVDVRRP
ncbi:hypothetical protein IV500_01045 [Paeniglutamicibacter antarcticus]|uniref:AMIN-like domain-containing protein n=1 Tax=Arthrobacter terrae TaxID=2935737 RepID=A0A931CNC6_9MICC|nr:hypothetical protein [Arthrobacter terrae]MBG0738024.1 hypothetical protein [Arthrobacter terrae]